MKVILFSMDQSNSYGIIESIPFGFSSHECIVHFFGADEPDFQGYYRLIYISRSPYVQNVALKVDQQSHSI